MSKSSSGGGHQRHFPGFSRLSETVWYFEPTGCEPSKPVSNGNAVKPRGGNGNVVKSGADSTTTASHQGPDLIILATWMNADPKHIAKYITGYVRLFPSSPLLIVTNSALDIFVRPENAQTKRRMPALSIIRACVSRHQQQQQEQLSALKSGSTPPPSFPGPHMLLHAFSNGGLRQSAMLASEYRAKFGGALPLSGMVFDSGPGIAKYTTGLAALKVVLPRFWLLRVLGLTALHFMVSLVWLSFRFVPRPNMFAGVRRILNDEEYFPPQAPRVYVYSKADQMVRWKDVQSHAAEATAKGFRVEEDVFEESKHVGHMIEDPGRYWGVVMRIA